MILTKGKRICFFFFFILGISILYVHKNHLIVNLFPSFITAFLQPFSRNLNQNVMKSAPELESEEELDSGIRLMELKDSNALNRSITSIYTRKNNPTSTLSEEMVITSKDGFKENEIPKDKINRRKSDFSGNISSNSYFISKEKRDVVNVKDQEEEDDDSIENDDKLSRTEIPDIGGIEHNKSNENTTLQENKKRSKEKDIDGRSRKHKRRQMTSSSSSKMDTSSPDSVTTQSIPTMRLSDLGGIEAIHDQILQLVKLPLLHPEIYTTLGTPCPRGILLHGPPGCGKTLLANAIAGECEVPFISISAPSIVSGMSGESEKKIREVFHEAKEKAPCIIFMDEIDAITGKRETASREMERRIVAQLLTCMDGKSFKKFQNSSIIYHFS